MRPSPFACLLLVSVLVGCSHTKGPKRCYTAADCHASEVCSQLVSGARTCLDECDSIASPTCVGGNACVSLPAEDAQVDVCLPGGTIVEYAACSVSNACVLGAICVLRSGQASSRCEKLCEVGAASTCMGSQVCAAIDDAVSTTRGTCIVP